ncbi:MAG: hypothetical protein ACLTKG_04215 [Collinsella intestinalis]
MLSSDDIDPVHVETVRRALVDSGFNAAVRCIAASDALGAETALAQYAELSAAGITAEDLIVGVGGDEACSLASYISRTWCGGVSCALVPTTLDAMIRCSTQMTPLTVSGGSLVSLEPEVSLVVCDLALVGDCSIEENGLGYALMCGAYLSESRACWDGFGTAVRGIVEKNETSLSDALSTTLTARLNIAKSVSPSAGRALLFGHTTARALSACLGEGAHPYYLLLAEGMRFEARLAIDACDFSVDEVFALDDPLEDLGIGELSFDSDPAAFSEALRAERFRVANRFQLARSASTPASSAFRPSTTRSLSAMRARSSPHANPSRPVYTSFARKEPICPKSSTVPLGASPACAPSWPSAATTP